MKFQVKYILIVLFFPICTEYTLAQKDIDTLELVKKLKQAPNDSIRLIILNELTSINRDNNNVGIDYAMKMLAIGPKENKEDYGYAFLHLATIYKSKGKHKLAEEYAIKAKEFATTYKLVALEARAYGTLGNIYTQIGDVKNSSINLEKSVSLFVETKDTIGIMLSSSNLGGFYYNENMYDKALSYFRKVLAYAIKKNDPYMLTQSYNNIGGVCLNTNQFDSAFSCYKSALKIAKENKFKSLANTILGNLGDTRKNQGKWEEALVFYFQEYEEAKREDLYKGISGSLSGIIEVYKKQKKYDLALKKMEEYKKHASDNNGISDLIEVYGNSAEIYLAKGMYKEAYAAKDRYFSLKDSIGSDDIKKQVFELHEQYQGERKDNEILKKTAELEKEQLVTKQRSSERNILLIIVVFAVVMIGFVLRGYFQKKKYNQEITMQKNEAEQQRELVEEKNKEILDSINYAKRIQQAILPPDNFIRKYLPNSFVLYQPKDIVAGDFYWMHISKENIIIAAADCTGHGVPGALVSLVCSNALNRTVNEFAITKPGEILDKVRDLVMETFSKSENEVKDGMDISICSINSKTKEVLWSGANNPLWYLSNGVLQEIKADKQPIGKGYIEKPFTTHKVNLAIGDMLYLFTDGYPDQFGGPNGKKFKYKKLQELISNIYDKSVEEQKNILENSFKSWRGAIEQVDDVCIIGIRV